MPSHRPPNNCPFVAAKKSRRGRRREKRNNSASIFRLKPEKMSTLKQIIRKYQPKSCLFCDSSIDDENLCGDLRRFEPLNLTVHYFCLLFSPNLIQNHDDSYGLAGFRVGKVVDEIIQAQKNICIYCSKPGANARCLHKESFSTKRGESVQFCDKNFHVSCGRTNKALMQFFGAFRTYCHQHYVIPEGPWERRRSGRMRFYGYGMVRCGVCSSFVKSRADLDVFRSFCCKFAYFHAQCAQKLALSAGSYALKCPLCNNEQDFQNYLLDRGVYIPIRDSIWEIDGENRYAPLYERPRLCSSENCESKLFTELDELESQILYCFLCGSQAVHKRCAENSTTKMKKTKTRSSGDQWKCPTCEDFDKRTTKSSTEIKEAGTPTTTLEAKKPPKKRKSKNLKRKKAGKSDRTSIKNLENFIEEEKTIDLDDDSTDILAICQEQPAKKRRKKRISKSLPTVRESPPTSPATSSDDRRLRPLVPPGVVYAPPSPATIDDCGDVGVGGDSFWDFLRPAGQTGRLPTNVQPIVAITDCRCVEIRSSPDSTGAVVNGDQNDDDDDSDVEILFTRIVSDA